MIVTKNKLVNRRGLHPCLHQSLKLFLLYFSMKNSKTKGDICSSTSSSPLLFFILDSIQYSKGRKWYFIDFQKCSTWHLWRIFLKLIWHLCFCSLVKGQRNEGAHKDGWRSYINSTQKIIQFSSALTATGKQPRHVLNLQ